MVQQTAAKIASLNVEDFTREVRTARASIQILIDRREAIKQEIATMNVLNKPDRMAKAADLIERLDASVRVYKDFKAQVNAIQKDFEGFQKALTDAVFKEMTGEEYQASNGWSFKKKLNPPAVGVKNESQVEKKWRKKPLPHPPWSKWPLDKAKIAKALKSGKEVVGCFLTRSTKLLIEKKL
jgi:hypothetical protein